MAVAAELSGKVLFYGYPEYALVLKAYIVGEDVISSQLIDVVSDGDKFVCRRNKLIGIPVVSALIIIVVDRNILACGLRMSESFQAEIFCGSLAEPAVGAVGGDDHTAGFPDRIFIVLEKRTAAELVQTNARCAADVVVVYAADGACGLIIYAYFKPVASFAVSADTSHIGIAADRAKADAVPVIASFVVSAYSAGI